MYPAPPFRIRNRGLIMIMEDLIKDKLVLSGGLATEIERRGVNISNDPLWSARVVETNPQIISDIHKSFLMHGADIITTATYQVSVDGYREHLGVSESDAIGLIVRSVDIAKEAVQWFLQQPQCEGRKVPLIGGSVGPYGAALHDGSEYTGSYIDTVTGEVIKEWHRPRLQALLAGGVDFIAVETIPSLKEALLVVDLLQELNNASRAWVSFTCKDVRHTSYGDVFAEAVKQITKYPQVVATGINCTHPHLVLPLLQSCSDRSKPFVIYTNSGEEWDGANHKWAGQSVDITSSLINQWCQYGVSIIGGCCRVTPEDILAIRTVFLQ